MYGQPELPRPEFMVRSDKAFIQSATSLFKGDRKAASRGWAAEADRFFKNGNLDFAMRRFNQAWLLDESYYLPYWGFGQVLMVQGRPHEAIKFYEKAKLLIDDTYQKPALYTDLGIAYTSLARIMTNEPNVSEKYFKIANNYFEESSMLDAKYPIVWLAWANSLYDQRRFAEAWSKVRSAREFGHVVSPNFLDRLTAAMAEPK